MMVGNGVECVQGHLYHIWRFQILMAAILDFLQRGLPMISGQNVTFPLSLCMVKSDLEMMFGDGVECVQGHFHHIWRFQILMVAIVDFLQRGLPMILGQNVTFPLSLCTVKSDLEMMFGDGVECVQGHFHHIWRFQILMDFLQRGLPMIFGQNVTFLLSLCTVKSDLEMMFGDDVECEHGHLYHIWRFQILMAAILDLF